MTQAARARAFAALHVKGNPVILYNIWDAGSAKAVAEGGAAAVATGSWSVAAAAGYPDGEKLPLEALLTAVERIVASVAVPLTVDFEGGYATAPEAVAANVAAVMKAGAIGINFEDQIVGGSGLHAVDAQAARIRAIRARADDLAVPLFLNARTDLFLKEKDAARHGALVEEAVARAAAYAAAGASGFFVPGLVDPALIADLCRRVTLPVNVMLRGKHVPLAEMPALGVARISHGPGPYASLMEELTARAAAIYRR